MKSPHPKAIRAALGLTDPRQREPRRVKPVIFSGPMVRAIMEGRKTLTRRLCKQEGCAGCNHPGNILVCWNENGRCSRCDGTGHEPPEVDRCPYGAPGTVLWVRETTGFIGPTLAGYAADGWKKTESFERVVPSIHMPYWACRLWLEVVSVRVERVQDISTDDAEEEGALLWWNALPYEPGKGRAILHPKDAFQRLWDSIHGKGSWAANPWVFRIEFKRTEKP